MMNIGASTANLYPMPTEQALKCLLEAGFREIEVFVNTKSEVEPSFAEELRHCADAYGARIVSLHPYTSGNEPYLLFSAYKRRYEDGLNEYARIYEAAAIMGASYVILHGDRLEGALPLEQVFLRYEQLFDLGQSNGVTLLQENVVRFRSSQISYIRAMRKYLGCKAMFVFDSKQCTRCGLEPKDVISAMGDGIRHVHISDRDANHDCLIPGQGAVDYVQLLSYMKNVGFNGDWILELYRKNFSEVKDLVNGYNILKKLIIS